MNNLFRKIKISVSVFLLACVFIIPFAIRAKSTPSEKKPTSKHLIVENFAEIEQQAEKAKPTAKPQANIKQNQTPTTRDTKTQQATPKGQVTITNTAMTNGTLPKVTGHIWNLQNADIKSVIDEVAKETGKNFLVDPRVSGQVNLISTKPLPPKALYPVFLAMLETYGYAAIPNKGVIKIVPNINAVQYASPVATPQHPGIGDEVTVRVIPVAHVSATQLIPVLRPLLPQWSTVSAYPPENLIILSGSAANLTRIAAIIKRIDIVSNNGVDILPLQYANAEQVANILKDLQSSAQTNGGSTAQLSIVPDDRTNSVIISGNEERRLRMRVIVSQLDTDNSRGAGSTQVVFLDYLQAKKVAPILDKVAKGQSKQQAAQAGKSTSNGSGGDDDISNLTAVLPEETDNALIITAPKSLMNNIKSIIAQLDIRPAQVYLQAIIVELDASSIEKLGVQWGTFGFGTNDLTDTGSQLSPNTAFQGGAGVGVIQNGHFSALAAAIRGISGANILSEPTIMVLDNQKATFSVGKQISIQSQEIGSVDGGTDNNGAPQTLSNFKQEDVGLKLVVSPQINHGNTVQLSIDQQNGSLQNPDNPGTQPIINKSDIKTSVLVNNGSILVLGGLMSNSMTNSTYRTPLLGDIPVIGNLFTYKSHQLEKKDLMIFLRPVIIKTPLDGTNISRDKYNYVRNLQLDWKYNDAEKDNRSDRLLPPRGMNLDLPEPF